ncbi:MAG: 50S ribosomal protein L25/general stress protein Ctc [Acidipropionibacterium jensenii]|nr:50S ribosomal protein L25/general stress protein Ctc [Acidipropionibacterium jensenii]
MADVIVIKAAKRTEFGKGAARRIRREDLVPAVMYGHGSDPIHITLPGHETLLALRSENPLLSIEVEGDEPQLALPKDVQRDILTGFVRHVDLLTVRRGEKVTVTVSLRVEGEPEVGTVATVDVNEVEVNADPLNIPESLVVDVTDLPAGHSINLGSVPLPEGVELAADPEAVAISIVVPAAEREEPEASDEDAVGDEDAEGEAADAEDTDE